MHKENYTVNDQAPVSQLQKMMTNVLLIECILLLWLNFKMLTAALRKLPQE